MERSEEILVASMELEPIGTSVGRFVPALPAGWSMNNICEQNLCPVSTFKCTLSGCPLPVLENTRPNPARRLKVPPQATPRLEKESLRGFPSFFASTCFACHSRFLQTFVNKICVFCQLHTL